MVQHYYGDKVYVNIVRQEVQNTLTGIFGRQQFCLTKKRVMKIPYTVEKNWGSIVISIEVRHIALYAHAHYPNWSDNHLFAM